MFLQDMTADESNIVFQPGDRVVTIGKAGKSVRLGRAVEPASVLAVALANGIAISHSCGGMGSCTTCRVFILPGSQIPSELTALEQEAAQARGFADNERLACQLEPIAGLIVRIPDTLETGLDET
jgi:2Fe-2S ferredoxin